MRELIRVPGVSDVTEAVSTFAGTKEQEDDLTLVVAKIL